MADKSLDTAAHLTSRPEFAKATGEDSSPMEVGFFIPPAEDSSNRVVNYLAEKLIATTNNINVVIFRTAQPEDSRIDHIPLLAKKRFLHGTLLRDVVFPFQIQNAGRNPPDALLEPVLLAAKHAGRVRVVEVPDPNAPDFIEQHVINNPALKMAFSIRNLTIFKQGIIDAFAAKGEASFNNIHPGGLPDVRGLEAPFWTRFLDKGEYCTTMHVIDPRIDAGRILDYETRPVNGSGSKAVATYPRDAASQVGAMIFKQIHLVCVRGARRSGIEQREDESRYFTLPTADDLEVAWKKGIKYVAGGEQIQYLLERYSDSETAASHHNALAEHLWHAYEGFKEGRYKPPAPEALILDEEPQIANAPRQETRERLLG